MITHKTKYNRINLSTVFVDNFMMTMWDCVQNVGKCIALWPLWSDYWCLFFYPHFHKIV